MKQSNGKNPMPKGFRITKDVKAVLLARTVTTKFGTRWHNLMLRDAKVFHILMDDLFPIRARAAQDEMILESRLEHNTHAMTHIVIECEYKEKQGNGMRVGDSMRGLRDLIATRSFHRWSDRDRLREAQKMAWQLPLLPTEYNPKPVTVTHGVNLYKSCKVDTLSKGAKISFYKHYADYRKLVAETKALSNTLEEALMQIGSVSAIKEQMPSVYEVLVEVAHQFKPPCTDIVGADMSCAVENLL